MKKYSIFALALVMGAMTLTSCEDAFGNFLDKQPSNELTKAEVLGNFTLLEENHNDTYNFLLHGANRVNNSWMDAATDLAESSIGTSGTRTTFNIGNYYGGGGAADRRQPRPRARAGHLRPVAGDAAHPDADPDRQGAAFHPDRTAAVHHHLPDHPFLVRDPDAGLGGAALLRADRLHRRVRWRGPVDIRPVADHATGDALHLPADHAADAALRPVHAGAQHA